MHTSPPFAGDDEGVVKLWDSRQAEAVATLEAHSGQRLRQGCCCGSTAVACVVRGGCSRPERVCCCDTRVHPPAPFSCCSATLQLALQTMWPT